MFRHRDCREYRLWKKEEARKKSKATRKVGEKKRKEKMNDCLEEEDEEDDVDKSASEVNYRRCKEKKKSQKIKAKRLLTREVPMIDVLLGRIQPPIDQRKPFLNPRHTACAVVTTSRMDHVSREGFINDNRVRNVDQKGERIRRKQSRKYQRARSKSSDNREQNGGEKAVKSVNETTTNMDNKEIDGGRKDDIRNKRKGKKIRRHKIKVKKKLSCEEEECDSICSSDSDVCLADVKLTKKDKKLIEENRSHVWSSRKEE